jgi:hypothetical protein
MPAASCQSIATAVHSPKHATEALERRPQAKVAPVATLMKLAALGSSVGEEKSRSGRNGLVLPASQGGSKQSHSTFVDHLMRAWMSM